MSVALTAIIMSFMSFTPAFFRTLSPKTVIENRDQKLLLFGTGPPVAFSSGLYGVMPRRLYTEVFANMIDNVTLVVETDIAPLSANKFESMRELLAVDKLSLFSHSSVDADILRANTLNKAVLCDPVSLELPIVGRGKLAEDKHKFLTLRAGVAYETNGIPEYLNPFATTTETKIFQNMGHADLLDDSWAELGPRVLPWMKGMQIAPRSMPFQDWQPTIFNQKHQKESRESYRKTVATLAVEHLLDTTATCDARGFSKNELIIEL